MSDAKLAYTAESVDSAGRGTLSPRLPINHDTELLCGDAKPAQAGGLVPTVPTLSLE